MPLNLFTRKSALTVTAGLLLFAGPAIPIQADRFDDTIQNLDLEDSMTQDLLRFYLDEMIPEEPVDEATADDPAESGEADAKEIIDPVVNPPINEKYFQPSEKMFLLYPETTQSLTPEEENEVIPVFDEIGESAKSEYVKGAMLSEKGFSSQALNHYLTAVERDPQNLWLKNRAAQLCLQQSDFSKATKLSNEVLDSDPDNHTAMHTLAMIDYYRDRLDKAIGWYEKILETKSGNVQALESLARIAYINERDYEKTKEYCARIMEVTSRNLNAILWYAEASAITGEIRHAADLYGQLVHYRPSLINRLSDMATRLIREERRDEAEELLFQGVILRPQSRLVVLQWQQLVMERAGVDGIDEQYLEMVGENPLDLQIRETYCAFLLEENLTDKLRDQRLQMLDMNPRHTPSLLSLANLELSQDKLDDAVEYFDKALATAYNDPAIHREVGLTYLNNGKREKAIELLTTAALLDPEDARTLVALALLAEEDGDINKAEQTLKLALDSSPADRDILGLLASLYEKTDRPYEASQILEQLTAVDPTDRYNQIALAKFYMELDDESALDGFEKRAPKQVGEKLSFFIDYGKLAIEYGYFSRAKRSFENALRESPELVYVRSLYATSLLHVGEYENAEDILLRARSFVDNAAENEKERKEKEHLLALVQFYMRSSQFEKALDHSERLLDTDRGNLYYHDLYLRALSTLPGNEDEIKKTLNQLVRNFGATQPNEVKMIRAEAHSRQEEYDRAISIIRPLLEEPDANRISLKLSIADLFGSKKDIESAERFYREVIDEIDGNESAERALVTALNNFAYLLSSEGIRLDEAEKMATRANEMNPRQDFILDTLGWIKYQKKELKDAEKLLLQAWRFSLNDSEIASHLGILYEDLNKPNEALKYFEKALKADPGNQEWAQKIDELTKTVGNVMEDDSAADTGM